MAIMSMDHVRAAVDRVVPLVNRTRSLNARPFDAETPVRPLPRVAGGVGCTAG